jgi:hypothetical protein
LLGHFFTIKTLLIQIEIVLLKSGQYNPHRHTVIFIITFCSEKIVWQKNVASSCERSNFDCIISQTGL